MSNVSGPDLAKENLILVYELPSWAVFPVFLYCLSKAVPSKNSKGFHSTSDFVVPIPSEER